MRAVEIKMLSTGERPADFELQLQSLNKTSGAWNNVSSAAITTGTPEAERRILLQDGERIVIEARGSDVEVVYDKVNNAAMSREALESQPTAEEKIEMEAQRQKEHKATVHIDGRLQTIGNQAAEDARRKAIADQQARAATNQSPTPPGGLGAKIDSPPAGQVASSSKPPVASATHGDSTQGKVTGATVPPTTGPKAGMTAPGPSTAGQSSKDVK